MASNTNSDAAALLGQPDKDPVYIYRVFFDVLLSIEESEEPINISDSIDVSSGPDAREAQAKVEDFVINSGKYKGPANEFFITGSKRLATSEI